jgi:hypothetical protein
MNYPMTENGAFDVTITTVHMDGSTQSESLVHVTNLDVEIRSYKYRIMRGDCVLFFVVNNQTGKWINFNGQPIGY